MRICQAVYSEVRADHDHTGLAVFTIFKAGFVFSGKAGSGLVISKLPDGSWSAPSCIATAGESVVLRETSSYSSRYYAAFGCNGRVMSVDGERVSSASV